MVLSQINWRKTLRRCVARVLLLTMRRRYAARVLFLSICITVSIVFVTTSTLYYKVNVSVFPRRHVEPVSEYTVDVDRVNNTGDVANTGDVDNTGGVDNIVDAPITSLIDMPLNFNYRHASRHIKYTILWYNPMKYINQINKELKLETCQYNNCQLTEDHKYLNGSKVVIVGIDMPIVTNTSTPPSSQTRTDPNQIWIYLALEPPILNRFSDNITLLYNTMNWSMSFNLDSDVVLPYGAFKTRPRPYTQEPNYGRIYDMKTKMAVWVVSNCRNNTSRRQEFVAALQRAGVEVDIYGKCGDRGLYYGDIRYLMNRYKFYLSLENSFCKYYVTEKVIARYNDDVIMLIRGGADYSRLIPNDTYVNAAAFPNVRLLAKRLLDISSNKTRYIEMLRNKYKYYTVDIAFTYPRAMCDICRKLNNLGDIARKIIVKPEKHNLEEGRCIDPRTIVIQ